MSTRLTRERSSVDISSGRRAIGCILRTSVLPLLSHNVEAERQLSVRAQSQSDKTSGDYLACKCCSFTQVLLEIWLRSWPRGRMPISSGQRSQSGGCACRTKYGCRHTCNIDMRPYVVYSVSLKSEPAKENIRISIWYTSLTK